MTAVDEHQRDMSCQTEFSTTNAKGSTAAFFIVLQRMVPVMPLSRFISVNSFIKGSLTSYDRAAHDLEDISTKERYLYCMGLLLYCNRLAIK